MTEAVFVVSKHPFGRVQDGETRITRLLLEAAAQSCEVRVVALTNPADAARPDVVEVAKPPVRLARLAAASIARRRSLIHLRFAPSSLRRALAEIPADVLVARRLYMAEAAIDAGRIPPRDRLVALVDVLESMVLGRRRSRLAPLLSLEARRTRRDEIRCLATASRSAFLSDTEMQELGRFAPAANRLDLILPPADRQAPLDDRLALFVGDRRWPPNAEALSRLGALWPRIADRVPGARLVVAGAPGPAERPVPGPDVQLVGYVDDLDSLWGRAGVLVAPVPIGGGVRVKVLDAARHGVPVVGTAEAIGSTHRYLPLAAASTDDEFVDAASALLADAAERRRRGSALYERNRELDTEGFVAAQLAALLVT